MFFFLVKNFSLPTDKKFCATSHRGH